KKGNIVRSLVMTTLEPKSGGQHLRNGVNIPGICKQELGLEVWPEFFFSTERLYRIDYAIPVAIDGKILKIAIEQEGGIWMKGNSGHSSGTGIKRDMDKNNLLQSLGWRLIRRQPSEMISIDTLELIVKVIS
ncbi:hypothetical protein ACR788_23640, partial [Sphingobacterium siyangense]|uniref:hypothetical protein n=1 Tax=Sphingobacterium siyangense TaxID=459529 RepID=UPI003DA69160